MPGAGLPLLPHDVRRLEGLEEFPSQSLSAGASSEGVLVFPVNRNARDLALTLRPYRPGGEARAQVSPLIIDLESSQGNL